MASKVKGWDCVVGLTGGMGSGKSTVLGFLKKKGAVTYDADQIVHQLLANDKNVLTEIRRAFGAGVVEPSGGVNRKKLAEQIFTSAKRRKQLEKILHPRVRQKIWSELKNRRGRIAVLDIPLLFESKWEKSLDGVIVANASLSKRIQRLKAKGFRVADAKRRIAQQMNLQEKVRRADFVVQNNGSLKNTQAQVNEIWKRLLNLTEDTHGIAARTKNPS